MKALHVLPILFLFLFGCATSKVKPTVDGSSVETAIVVKSIDEEYKYVKKVCPDCKLSSQQLISKKGKFYDVLNMVKSDGQKVSYYFDINSFFGKM